MPKKISAAAPGTDASARDAGSDKHDEYLHYAEHCLAMARLAPDRNLASSNAKWRPNG
jgi:hypothetical protein